MELAYTLAGDYDIADFLHLLVERCAALLNADTAGVLLETPEGQLRLAAAVSEEMRTSVWPRRSPTWPRSRSSSSARSPPLRSGASNSSPALDSRVVIEQAKGILADAVHRWIDERKERSASVPL